MKQPVKIHFQAIGPADGLKSSAREHLRKLESFGSDIVACQLTINLEQEREHQHHGGLFSVRLCSAQRINPRSSRRLGPARFSGQRIFCSLPNGQFMHPTAN